VRESIIVLIIIFITMSETNKSIKCPVCGYFMKSFTTHYWRDKKLTFPYEIYRCEKHGVYVKRQDKLELVNFSSLQHEAKETEILQDANVKWFDPTIVEMKCPICGERWMQYEEFPSVAYGGVVFCPNDHSVKRETIHKK